MYWFRKRTEGGDPPEGKKGPKRTRTAGSLDKLMKKVWQSISAAEDVDALRETLPGQVLRDLGRHLRHDFASDSGSPGSSPGGAPRS